MVSKSMVQTFSYPVKYAEMIEEATRMAKADGVSFSEFIVSLVMEEVRKKAEGTCNPLNLRTNSNSIHTTVPNKQADLRNWLPRDEAIKMARKLPISHQEWSHIAETFTIIARKKKTGYL